MRERFPQRSARELHNLYAVTENLTKVLVSGDLSYDGALDRFTVLDGRIRAGEKLLVEGYGTIRFLAVRSVVDTDWPAQQPNHAVASAI